MDKFTRGLVDGEFVLCFFLDFSKVFDTVNHAIQNVFIVVSEVVLFSGSKATFRTELSLSHIMMLPQN